MSNTHDTSPAGGESAAADAITASIVAGQDRPQFLPRVFGARLVAIGEGLVYRFMSALCPEYGGGFWDFVDLSNGGFYLRLRSAKSFAVQVEGNGFVGALSADAASIVATLFALNYLVWRGDGHLDEAFMALRSYAGQHAEGPAIFAAID
ncbi:MAG: antirestriction protein [Rubrivivax sp.]